MGKKQTFSLDEIARRKAEVLNQIRMQKDSISTLSQSMTDSAKPVVHNVSTISGFLSRGSTLIDGILLGIQLTRKVRRLFRR